MKSFFPSVSSLLTMYRTVLVSLLHTVPKLHVAHINLTSPISTLVSQSYAYCFTVNRSSKCKINIGIFSEPTFDIFFGEFLAVLPGRCGFHSVPCALLLAILQPTCQRQRFKCRRFINVFISIFDQFHGRR